MALAHTLEGEIDKMLACVHCGLCLQACPTYVKLGNENDSPRGRAYLMRAVAEHRLEIDNAFINHMELCLQCRACEVACPSGLNYGHIMEAARAEIAASSIAQTPERKIRRFVLNHILVNKAALRIALWFANFLKRTGIAELLIKSGVFLSFPVNVEAAVRLLLPDYSGKEMTMAVDYKTIPSTKNRRVAFLEGCVMPGMFGYINAATKRVLAANGCEIVAVDKQGCCGALHAHAGELEMAQELARKNIDAFEAADCEAFIVNSAGCGAAMKEYHILLKDDPDYSEKAARFSRKTQDISEFLASIDFRTPTAQVNQRVTYDAPCHLLYVQKVKDAPLEIIKSIPGVQFIAQRDAEVCCGGAGIYNMTQPEMSMQLQSDKVKNILTTKADIVATGNPGCHMQLATGLYTSGHKEIRVTHPVELLDEAYEASGFYQSQK
ncbi:MAG TPA: heterodisulfide reductase-related iron-sulfur binding cluster [Blastocatellia bacterium]|nr:heterodisulfide reductase-related iron-sulfur binding cluster [Blastocatellia bacterium]